MPSEAARAIGDAERRTVTDRRAQLEHEARVMTRYLLDRDCPDEMAERYVRGIDAIFGESDSVDRVTAYATRHTWSLAPLDSAGAVTGRAADLRARLQLMAAILEASPMFADRFLASPRSRGRALATLALCALRAAAQAAIGVPLLLFLEWTS